MDPSLEGHEGTLVPFVRRFSGACEDRKVCRAVSDLEIVAAGATPTQRDECCHEFGGVDGDFLVPVSVGGSTNDREDHR